MSTSAVPASPLRTGCLWLSSGGILILNSVVFFLFGLLAAWQEFTFQTDNAAASAKITGQGIQHNSTTPGKPAGTFFYVSCEWTVDGKSQIATVNVSQEFYAKAEAGQPIEIQYRKSNPADARLAGTNKWLAPLVCFGVSLASLSLGRYLFSWNQRRLKQ